MKNIPKILLLIGLQVLCSCSLYRDHSSDINQNIIYNNPLVLEGSYQGKNISVQNPFTEDGYCTQYVIVNGVQVLDSVETQKSAYEIDLTSLDLNTGSAVKIEIYHNPDCMPKVLYTTVH